MSDNTKGNQGFSTAQWVKARSLLVHGGKHDRYQLWVITRIQMIAPLSYRIVILSRTFSYATFSMPLPKGTWPRWRIPYSASPPSMTCQHGTIATAPPSFACIPARRGGRQLQNGLFVSVSYGRN